MMLSPHRTFYPLYVQDLGRATTWIAALSAARLAMAMLASLVGGLLSDTIGRKWTLFAGDIGFVAGSVLFLTRAPGWVGVLWTVSGFGMGLRTLGAMGYLMDAAGSRSLGVLSALFNWGYTVGGALSGPLAALLLAGGSYARFGIALTALALSALAVNALALPSLGAIPSSSAASTPAARSHAPWRDLFGYGHIAARRPVLLLTATRFLPTVYWGMAIVLIPLLLRAAGADKATIAGYAAVSQVIAALSQIAAGRAADRYGAAWPTAAALTALVASILCTGLLPDRLWSVYAFGTAGTAAAWSLSTLLPILVARVTETEERGRVLGWIHLWWNVAMMVGSMLGGALYERSAGLPFLVAGSLNTVSIALTWAFFRLPALAAPAEDA
jgi:MFS family permease